MARLKCTSLKQDGTPCQSFASGDSGLCVAHDPARKDAQRDAARRGGEQRANARRAARSWAVIGEQVRSDDLPAMLRAAMIAVKAGSLEPAQATAIATLAKTSVSITNEIELERRLEALEAASGLLPNNVRRLAS